MNNGFQQMWAEFYNLCNHALLGSHTSCLYMYVHSDGKLRNIAKCYDVLIIFYVGTVMRIITMLRQ